MKKFVFIILLIATIANAWRTKIDSMQIADFLRLYQFPFDQIIFVNSSDSTVDTTGIIVEKFGIRDITFPQVISFDTGYGGSYIYVPNSDQALYINAGNSSYNPDSGAGMSFDGENTGSAGDLFMNSGNSGRIYYYSVNGFRFTNFADTLRFYYTSGDDGFTIRSKRLELVGREGVGHGLAIDSFYVAVDDTFLVRNGAVGIGTDNPSTVAGFSYGLSGGARNVTINDDTYQSVLSIEGNSAKINLIDNAGGTDDKLMQLLVDDGVMKFRSLNDDGTPRVDDILSMDMGTGNIYIYNVDGERYLTVESENDNAILSIHSDKNGTATGISKDSRILFYHADTISAAIYYDKSAENLVIGSSYSTNEFTINMLTGLVTIESALTADSIYADHIGIHGASACSLFDGATFRATATASWHQVGNTFTIDIPELSGNVTSGDTTYIKFATGTLPNPAIVALNKPIWVAEDVGGVDYAIRCCIYGGSGTLKICANPPGNDLGTLLLTIYPFPFTWVTN